MLTIYESFQQSVKNFPDNIAIRYYQDEVWEQITYAELNHAVTVTASGMQSMGIGKDSKVAIMSDNRPEWIVSYLAIVAVGAIAVPIDYQLGEVETEHILNHSGTQTIICSMRCYDVLSRILGVMEFLKTIIIFDRNITVRHEHRGDGMGRDLANTGQKNNHLKRFISYDELRIEGNKAVTKGTIEFPKQSLTDLASIIYTSGTTGSPKGVILTHKNFMSNIDSIRYAITTDEHDNFLLLLPLHHSFPFTTCMVLPLSNGATISFIDILSRDRTRLIMECQPTLFIGVPLLFSKIYKGIIRQIETSKVKSFIFKYGGKKFIGRALKKKLGGKLRIMVSGAAPMDPVVIDGFVSLGIEFIEGYGLTETSPVVSVNPQDKIKIGSVGKPMKGVQVKIVNPDPDGIGEIVVKGDNVMQGYYKNQEQTDQILQNGWFYTGDLGKIDEEGYIFITGRAKDVIVTHGGKNVYPDVVEGEVNKSKFIAESIVLGYKTQGQVGEDVGILIYPDYEFIIEHARKEGMTFKEHIDINELTEDAKDELIEKFRTLLETEVKNKMAKLAPYQRITRIAIERDEFTKTSTKKIKRFLYNGRLDIVDIT